MKTHSAVGAELEPLRGFSTCIVASAIETFRESMQNTGFADSTIRCLFKDRAPLLGYAATARIRTVDPPMEGRKYTYDGNQGAWWRHILTIPAPRIVVIEDLDKPPGLGAFFGEVQANIFLALGCAGLVTNGSVRDVPQVQETGIAVFGRNVSVSHAYAHVVDFGGPVVVGGLSVRPGDLLHGDRHGVQTIPAELIERIPAAARRILERRRRVIALCREDGFSPEKLRAAIEEAEGQNP